MKKVMLFCDKCGKEIDGDPVVFIPEMRSAADTDEPASEESYEEIRNHVEMMKNAHFCKKCLDRIVFFAKHNAASEDPEFKKEVDKMTVAAKKQPEKRKFINLQEMEKMINNGKTPKEIAEHFGVTENSVRVKASINGISLRPKKKECP